MADQIPDQLKQVAEQIHDGRERTVDVRTLLSWFNAERRAYWKVREIRKALTKLKVKTDPDFENVWIGASIKIVPRTKLTSDPGPSDDHQSGGETPPVDATPIEDPTLVPGKVGDP